MIILNSLLLRRSKVRTEKNKAVQTDPEPLSASPEKPQTAVFQEQTPAMQPMPENSVRSELFSTRSQSRADTEKENDSADPQILLLLEKICSTLEQIAANTENCLQKMDSEDDDLKFN